MNLKVSYNGKFSYIFEYSTVTFDACAQYCCTSEGPYRTSSFFQKLKLKPEHILNHRTPRVDWTLPTEAQTDNQSIIVKLESGKLSLDIILVSLVDRYKLEGILNIHC